MCITRWISKFEGLTTVPGDPELLGWSPQDVSLQLTHDPNGLGNQLDMHVLI